MKTIVIFESAQNSGGSTYRAVEMAARIKQHKFIFLTFKPLNQIYRNPIPANIKAKRLYTFYFDYHAAAHTKKIEQLFKNKIISAIFRFFIAQTLSASKLLTVAQVIVALAFSKVDVVQANNGVHYLPYWIAKLKNAALFFYFRDLRDFTQNPKKFLDTASHYVFVGENLMDKYRSQLQLPKHKCIVIHSPFNVYDRLEEEPVDETNPIEQAKINGSKVIICSSRIAHEKGQEVLLKAFEIVAPAYPNAILFFVGETDANARCQAYLQNLHSRIEKSGLSSRVHFLGFRKDVLHLTAHANIAVQAPTYFEALSGALVESVQLGTPTISADIGGANEVIKDGISGYLFPPGDHEKLAAIISRILDNEEHAMALAEQGKRSALDQWNPEKMKERLCRIYEGSLAEDEPPQVKTAMNK
jgi:glycosyltransferase involved in cell wall biosynthesis